MGKSTYKWPFSIAMLNYQRVIQIFFTHIPYANHGAGIFTNICPCPKSPSFVGKYTSIMEHMGNDHSDLLVILLEILLVIMKK